MTSAAVWPRWLPALIAVFLVVAAGASTRVAAATLRVGPGQPIARIADAIGQARDGDVIEISPGTYRGDVAVIGQRRLTLRGVGQRPVLAADGRSAEGKAILVIRHGEIVIDNLEFRGARVADGNGAGIRLEHGQLHVHNSVFDDNQNGILTANFADAELRISDSAFRNAPGQTEPPPHLLYVGRIRRVEIVGSHFSRGANGHLIKSRARVSELRYNRIDDGPAGRAAYEVDLPNGGLARLIGNVIGQNAQTTNPVVVSYGEEGAVWPENTLILSHNTLLSDALPGAWFLRVAKEKFPTPPRIVGHNNLTVGIGLFSLGSIGEFHGNYPALSYLLGDRAAGDFRLTADSLLRGLAAPAAATDRALLTPDAEFTAPVGTRALTAPSRWAPGAFQTPAD